MLALWWSVCMGKQCSYVSLGGRRLIVCAGIRYALSQMHFVNGKWIQWYSDVIPRPIVVPLTCCHLSSCYSILMYSYVEGICKLCLEDDVILVLSGLYTQLTCHSFNMFLMFWFGVYNNIFQSLPISERVVQHSAGSSQEEPDPLWVFKEACCTALGKWWS